HAVFQFFGRDPCCIFKTSVLPIPWMLLSIKLLPGAGYVISLKVINGVERVSDVFGYFPFLVSIYHFFLFCISLNNQSRTGCKLCTRTKVTEVPYFCSDHIFSFF